MYKVVPLFAALALVAACASDPDTGAAATGTGTTTTTQQPTTTQTGVAAPRPGSQEELNATVGDRIFFDFDRYDVRPDQRPRVAQWAQWMNQHQGVSITVEGHADERGTREYNLALGSRRAQSVKDVLTSEGVSAARINTISYGKDRPAVVGSGESVWSQNRRGVVVVN